MEDGGRIGLVHVSKRSEREKGRRTISTGEQRLSADHLCKDTADAPDIDSAGVLLERKHNFRCAIPSRIAR